MAGNTITISVLAQTSGASKGLSGLAAKFDSVGSKLSKTGNVVGVASGAIVAGLAATIKPASDLQQNVGGVQAVFGKFANSVVKDSKRAASQFGLSANEYDSFATVIGSQLKNAGVSSDQLGKKTKSLIGLGSDLAATFGGTTSDAVDALSSAMKGEMDPIEKYGISLNQSMLQQQAAAMGISKNSSSWTNAQKQQIILAAVTKQSGDAQGQFAKQSGTVAEQQQILTAKLQNTVSKIGTAFLPMISKVASKVLDLVNGPGFKGFTDFLSKNPTLIVGLVAGLAGLAGVLKVAGTVMQSWSTITRIASAVQAAFNLVLSANPIGLIVIAIAALVAGLVWFFTQTKLGQAIVQVAWTAIQAAISAVVNWWNNTALPIIRTVWNAITSAFQTGKTKIAAFMNGALAVIKAVWNYSPYGMIVNNWVRIIAFFRAIPGKVKSFFSSAISWLAGFGRNVLTGFLHGVTAGWGAVSTWLRSMAGRSGRAVGNVGRALWGAGRSVIQGFLDGLQSLWSTVQSWFKKLTDKIPSWKGPARRDRTLLTGAGKLIMGSLVKGLRSGQNDVQSILADVTDMIGSSLDGTTGAAFAFGGVDLSAAAPRVIVQQTTVHAQMLEPSAAAGRVIADSVDEWNRKNGKRS